MRLVYLLLFFFTIQKICYSQLNEHQHVFELNSNIEVESNNLNRSFYDKMLFEGGFIDDNLKEEWIGSLDKQNNILYGNFKNEFLYTYKRKKRIYNLSVSDNNIINGAFSQDLFKLIFQGNLDYINQELNFDNTNLRIDRYQKYSLGYGIMSKFMEGYFSLSFLKGNHHVSWFIEKGSLFTNSYGNSLDIEYNMDIFSTDTANISAFNNNGNGLSISMNTSFNILNKKINLYVNDLGFIMWNTKSITSSVDSSFKFNGIEIDNLLDISDTSIDGNTIIDDHILTQNSSFKSYIPADIGFYVEGKSNYKFLPKYIIGFNVRWQPFMDNLLLSYDKIKQGIDESNYSPLYYVSSIIERDKFNLKPSLSYGGYTDDYNLGLEISMERKVHLILGTKHLEDIFANDKANSMSIYFRILKKI